MIKRFFTFTMAAALCVAATVARCPLDIKNGDQASVGIYVAPVNGGKALVDYDSNRLMLPASTMKSVTVAAALSKMGGDYRWTTTVKATGKVDSSGVLQGNLLVTGSGDPTLGSTHFAKKVPSFLKTLEDAAAKHGIKSVAGKTTNAAAWPGQGPVPSWELEDVPGQDGAGYYRLNWMDNVFTLRYPSMKSDPPQPDLEVQRGAKSGSLSVWRNAGSNVITVSGGLGKGQSAASITCSMPNPPKVLLHEIDSLLHVKGGNVNPGSETAMVFTYQSPALRDVCRSLMVRSDNQFAEATLRLLSLGSSRKSAISTERNILTTKGANLSGARIADGSGLSRHNALSPRHLTSVLRVMADNQDYVNSFARVGIEGTVKSFMKDMPNSSDIVLKSGSMTGVVCYCGYRLDPQTRKPTHVIAVMVNNASDSSQARAQIAKFLSGLQF